MSGLYVWRVVQWIAFGVLVLACLVLAFVVSLYMFPWQGPHEIRTPVPAESGR